MTIRPLTPTDLPSLVNLHYEVLPGEFLTSVSKSFLLSFYQNLFSSNKSLFIGIFEDVPARGPLAGIAGTQGDPLQKGGLVGAIVGIEEKYRPTIKTYIKIAFLIAKNLPYFLSKPKTFLLLYQSLIFKIKQHQETEIFFIGISKSHQGKGLGKKLILALEKEYRKKYSSLYVDCKCKLPSNDFYQKLGFKIKKSFTLYGESWNRYEKSLK